MLWPLYVSLSSTLGEEARLPLHVVLTVVVDFVVVVVLFIVQCIVIVAVGGHVAVVAVATVNSEDR